MNILFLGGGNMASALIGGMLDKGIAASEIQVIDPGSEARARLQQAYGVVSYAQAADAPVAPDVLLLAVKPQQMREAVAPWQGRLGNALVISIAAGLDLATLARWLGGHQRLVRAMPNTPALVGAGMTGCCATAAVDEAGRELADKLLQCVGATVWVE